MKKIVLLALCAALVAGMVGNAAAEDLRGRVAVTARFGIINPANGEKADRDGTLLVKSDAGVVGGGGFLFGLDDNIAMELEVTRSAYHATGFGDAGVTDVAMGAQYRLPEKQRFVPYGGAGIDVLINDAGSNVVDTVVGLYVKAGVDYMLMRQVALNAEIKGTEAFNADVRNFAGFKVGEFDPSNVGFTFGARFFFN